MNNDKCLSRHKILRQCAQESHVGQKCVIYFVAYLSLKLGDVQAESQRVINNNINKKPSNL